MFNFFSAIAVGLTLCSSLSAQAVPKPIEVEFKDSHGKKVGTAELTELKHGVKIDVLVQGLPPGEHAFHIHEKGSCESPSFKSAGDHFSPEGRKHGYDFGKGPHEGDLPNIVVGQNGSGRAEIINSQVTLSQGPKSLLSGDGTALIIHASPDDYKSQPSGSGGQRIACGEIRSAG